MRTRIGKFGIAALLFCSIACLSAQCAETAKSLDTADKIDDLLGAVKSTGAKVILLNFWSLECSPCLAEIPVLVRLSARHKDNNNVAFLGLCLPAETPPKEVQAGAAVVMQQKQVTYRNLVWTGKGEALFDRFNMLGTPFTLLLSPDGKVLSGIEMPEDLDKAGDVIEKSIAEALNSPASSEKPAVK